jgi:hypothetical protein
MKSTIPAWTIRNKTFEKCSNSLKFKERNNSYHGNISSISRVKIDAIVKSLKKTPETWRQSRETRRTASRIWIFFEIVDP